MNKTFAFAGKKILKELLVKCTEQQHLNFKRMYSHNNLDINIYEAVDKMDDEKISHAITQLENTIIKNEKTK